MLNFSNGQQNFLTAIENRKNVFLTGKAGAGKSFIVKKAIEQLEATGVKVIAIAPTGVAANNIDGQTIHSMFNINPYGIGNWESCNFLSSEKRRMLAKVQTIFIDEVSMLRPDVLDVINWTLIKNGFPNGLATYQLVLVGDLKQLPPVLNDNSRSVLYEKYDGEEFYNAKCYSALNIENIELTEILRQSDPEFINNLNIVRNGGKSEYFRRFVGVYTGEGVVLAPHNATVESYNVKGLSEINARLRIFEARIEGNAKAEDFNVPTIINVKHGAKIMYLQNSQNNNLCNGTIGVFIDRDGLYFIKVGEVEYALEKTKSTKKEYVLNKHLDRLELREIGSIEQYPIKLAYALSIHKSQGLTFDNITVDLKRPCFQKGQLYVALSRVTSPNGLTIII